MLQVHPDDDTQDLDTAHPVVIISGNVMVFSLCLRKNNSSLGAITLLFQLPSFIFYYNLNIQYPNSAINTLNILQLSSLEIKGGRVFQEVLTLINKVKKKVLLSFSFHTRFIFI